MPEINRQERCGRHDLPTAAATPPKKQKTTIIIMKDYRETMKRYFYIKLVKTLFLAVLVLITSANAAYYSASIVPGSLIQGEVSEGLDGGSWAQETNAMNDWHLTNGSWDGDIWAISTTNSNYNGGGGYGHPDTVVAFGNGGSVTLKLDGPIYAVENQREFGIFTAQMINSFNGSFFNGNMEAAVLVSSDGTDWFTLSGGAVAQSYTGHSSKLNTPAMAYNFGTLAAAWTYGYPGASQPELDSLSVADYTIPMVNDNLFNGTATNEDRLAMETNGDALAYEAIFGASGGGNWFDISFCGLRYVEYIQLNGVNTDGGIRLDAVFTTYASTIPEPSTLLLLGLGSMLVKRIKKRG